ncbi:metal-dependent phosphohydrolase [Dactylosporangium sp. NPDC049525]|uniref:metal-dependent phosphohydrolase n=1 Tax=Dactylosporangium sp. NPDC049525 TaxID=3154730 RepID=UPI003431325B
MVRGHVIDHAPALAHAVKVAAVLARHLPDPPPQLLAAAQLHDAPEYAPTGIDLDTLLTTRLGPAVTTVVRGMQHEHEALAASATTDQSTADRWTLHASTADKIVSFRSILGRAERATDAANYWATRTAFLHRVDHFRAFHTTASAHLPERMSTNLARLVTAAEHAAATFTSNAPPPSTPGAHTTVKVTRCCPQTPAFVRCAGPRQILF